jgi:hypothetical protein
MGKLKSSFKEKRNLTGIRRIVVGGMSIPLLIGAIKNMKSRRGTAYVQLLSAGYLLFSSITGYSPLRALRDEYQHKPKRKNKSKASRSLV